MFKRFRNLMDHHPHKEEVKKPDEVLIIVRNTAKAVVNQLSGLGNIKVVGFGSILAGAGPYKYIFIVDQPIRSEYEAGKHKAYMIEIRERLTPDGELIELY